MYSTLLFVGLVFAQEPIAAPQACATGQCGAVTSRLSIFRQRVVEGRRQPVRALIAKVRARFHR